MSFAFPSLSAKSLFHSTTTTTTTIERFAKFKSEHNAFTELWLTLSWKKEIVVVVVAVVVRSKILCKENFQIKFKFKKTSATDGDDFFPPLRLKWETFSISLFWIHFWWSMNNLYSLICAQCHVIVFDFRQNSPSLSPSLCCPWF